MEENGFAPRLSLARTPPGRFSTPLSSPPPAPPGPQAAAKRPRSSPTENSASSRARMDFGGDSVPPVSGLTGGGPPSPPQPGNKDRLLNASKAELLSWAHDAVAGIMDATKASSSKMNKSEIAKIGSYGQEVLAVVAALSLRVADLELEVSKVTEQCGAIIVSKFEDIDQAVKNLRDATKHAPQGAAPARETVSYAGKLRLGNQTEVAKPQHQGPTLAVYPQEGESTLKTANDTRAEIKKTLDPVKLGLQVRTVRRVGNAGIVVQTTTAEAAEKIKRAIPPTLTCRETNQRRPLVALRNCDGDPTSEELMLAIHDQNFRDSATWTLDAIKKACKVAFKKSRPGDKRTTVVLDCSPEIRNELIERGQLYIGWRVIHVFDYVRVTCCRKCQLYGHPERLCRSKEPRCGKCGEIGHQADACKGTTTACATCKCFGRSGASTHKTMANDCPARKHAESRQTTMTDYGC